MHGYITRSVRLLAVPLLLAGVAGGVFPVTAAAARAGSPGPVASFSITGQLFGVAATSASNAWAVGTSGAKTLVMRWNGSSWTRVASPSPGSGGSLAGVAATSASNAWAVGQAAVQASIKTLILRWNGSAWK